MIATRVVEPFVCNFHERVEKVVLFGSHPSRCGGAASSSQTCLHRSVVGLTALAFQTHRA